MAKFRIKEYEFKDGKYYEVQKKTFLGYWESPNAILDITNGWFSTLEEAKMYIKNEKTTFKKTIVWTE
jgi:hypothetical protein